MMKQQVLITAENYTVKEAKNKDGFIIEGLALPFGKRSRNGLFYNPESIKATVEQWIGLPIHFNHDINKPIGHIEKAWIEDDGLHYRGNIDPAEEWIIRKLQRKDIPFVSIQAIVEPHEGGGEGDVDITQPLEISPVTIPGFPETTVNTINAISIEKFIAKSKIAGEPFAGYTDFDDCVKKNQDKDNPEAFCAWLEKRAKGEEDYKELVQELTNAGYFTDAFKEDKYPFDKCVADQKKRGYDEETAKKICAAIKNRTVKHLLDKHIAISPSHAIEIVAEVIGHNAEYVNNNNSEDITIMDSDKLAEELKKINEEIAKLKETMASEQEEPAGNPPPEDDEAKRLDALEQRITAIEDRLSKLEKAVGEPEEEPTESNNPNVPEGGTEGFTRKEMLEILRGG